MIFQSFFNLYNQVTKFYLLCTCNISLWLDCIYWWSVIKNIKKSIKNKTDRPSKIIDDVGLSLEDWFYVRYPLFFISSIFYSSNVFPSLWWVFLDFFKRKMKILFLGWRFIVIMYNISLLEIFEKIDVARKRITRKTLLFLGNI